MNGIELHDVLAGDDRGVKTPAAELDTNEKSTVPKNTRDGATIDAIADLVLRDAALCELNELMSAIRPEELYRVEIPAVLAILRGAKERLDAQQRPPTAVLELVRPA